MSKDQELKLSDAPVGSIVIRKPRTPSEIAQAKKEGLKILAEQREFRVKAKEERQGAPKGPLVQAVRFGYYGDVRQRVGAKFRLYTEEDFSDAEIGGWMVKIDAKDVKNKSEADLKKLEAEKQLSGQVVAEKQHGRNVEPMRAGNPVDKNSPPAKPKKKADEDIV